MGCSLIHLLATFIKSLLQYKFLIPRLYPPQSLHSFSYQAMFWLQDLSLLYNYPHLKWEGPVAMCAIILRACSESEQVSVLQPGDSQEGRCRVAAGCAGHARVLLATVPAEWWWQRWHLCHVSTYQPHHPRGPPASLPTTGLTTAAAAESSTATGTGL